MTNPQHRLEQALCMWEAQNMMLSAAAHRYVYLHTGLSVPLEGPVVNWSNLRQHLLHTVSGTSPYTLKDFLPTEALVPFVYASGSTLNYLPSALASWNSSRRIYHLTEQLQHLLQLTSLKDVTWGEVPWPFESFAVTLEVPIVMDDGTVYDCILVSREKHDVTGRDMLGIRLFSQDLDRGFAYTRDEKEFWMRAERRKDWTRIKKMMAKQTRKSDRPIKCSVFYLDVEKHTPVLIATPIAQVTDLTEQHGLDRLYGIPETIEAAQWDIAARLVVGLCLYLRSLGPKTSTYTSDWKGVVRAGLDIQAVTREAQVCEVSSIHVFSPEALVVLRTAGSRAAQLIALRAHFREGHWRRMPGFGQDPEAPRVVQVMPTIVRIDRLADGALPGGLAKVLH
jgi:hypothetical protein